MRGWHNYCSGLLRKEKGHLELKVTTRTWPQPVGHPLLTKGRTAGAGLQHPPEIWGNSHFKLGMEFYICSVASAEGPVRCRRLPPSLPYHTLHLVPNTERLHHRTGRKTEVWHPRRNSSIQHTLCLCTFTLMLNFLVSIEV